MATFKVFAGSNSLLFVIGLFDFTLQGGFVGLCVVAARIYPTEFRTAGLGYRYWQIRRCDWAGSGWCPYWDRAFDGREFYDFFHTGHNCGSDNFLLSFNKACTTTNQINRVAKGLVEVNK